MNDEASSSPGRRSSGSRGTGSTGAGSTGAGSADPVPTDPVPTDPVPTDPGSEGGASSGGDDFGILLTFAFVTFMEGLDAAMEEAGHVASHGQFGYVLRALTAGPLSLRALAERLDMSSPGALKIVDAMVAEGYVERAVSAEDRRVRTIALTDRGLDALAVARRFHRRFERELAAEVGPDVAAATRAALAAVVGRGSGRVPRLFRQP